MSQRFNLQSSKNLAPNCYVLSVTTRRSALLAGALTIAAATGLTACGSSTAAPTGADLVKQANTAAQTAGSVSIKIVATQGTRSQQQPAETLTSKISAPASLQSIRFPTGTPGNLDVMMIGSTAYVRTDATTLFKGLGLTKQGSKKYAGQWISIQQGDAPFAGIASTLTLDAQLKSFLPVGKQVTIGPTKTLHGKKLIPLTGPASSSHVKGSGEARLLIDPTTKLPAAGGVVKSASGQTVEVVARFSKWGKPVNLTAPTDAVPYSTATSG